MHTLLIPLLAFACKEPIPRGGDASTDPGENCQESSWYADSDQDLYGAGPAVMACTAPAGHVAQAGDCDDTDPFRYPSALEVCDGGLDNDCGPGRRLGVMGFPGEGEEDGAVRILLGSGL